MLLYEKADIRMCFGDSLWAPGPFVLDGSVKRPLVQKASYSMRLRGYRPRGPAASIL